jgi:hypothetical protein
VAHAAASTWKAELLEGEELTWGDWFRELTTGPAMGAIFALGGVWLTRWTTRSEGAANRADKRADQLREEVATVLAERPKMIDSQRELFDATMTHHEQMARNDPPPAERSARLMDVRQKHIALCDKVKHEVIRAELLTRNSEIEVALKTIRQAAENWNGPMQAAHRGGKVDEFDRFEKLQTDLANAFDTLETATRSMTAINFKAPKELN